MKMFNRIRWVSIAILCLSIFVIVGVRLHTTIYAPRPDLYSGVLVVNSDSGQGSCFVVAQHDGFWYAITAKHVVQMAPTLTVDDEKYTVELIRTGCLEDIALIRFKSPEQYRIYPVSRAEVGEFCVTVGWSQGSRLIYRGSIVALDYEGFVIANGGVLPGNSGGPLLDANDAVIGVTVQVAVYRGGVFDNTALYTPARFVEAIMLAGIGD